MSRINKSYVLGMILTCFVFTSVLSLNANADMGRIYVSNEAVTVSEDAQKAIILHNLTDEVLVLGTDLKASKKIGIIRFIPFPSEPIISLAPVGAFEKAAVMIKKYGLKYEYYHYSKGGPPTSTTTGIELRLNKKLGAHDLTIIKVNDISMFRGWVNKFFQDKGLPVKEKYPEEEAIVDDYVKRGIVYFVLDFVEVSPEVRFVEPVAYKFKSKALYYPLKTSNTFGGQGSIELIIIAPNTLCSPGNEPLDGYSGALYKEDHQEAQRPYNQRPYCLNIPVKASTSALLAKEEKDLDAIYPGGENFFKDKKAFIQVVSYTGKYFFKDDIFADVSTGRPQALGPMKAEHDNDRNNIFNDFNLIEKKECSLKPDRGPCKGIFDKFYYDIDSKACKKFIWGGCGGVVPFETIEECNNGCGPATVKLMEKTNIVRDDKVMEWKGSISNQKDAFIKVVETQKEWSELWERALDQPAPDMDFEKYAVACVFLGHSADWLYSIGFSQPFMRDKLMVIPFGLAEIIIELSGPFKASGQYRMKVFEKKKDVKMILEETAQSSRRR